MLLHSFITHIQKLKMYFVYFINDEYNIKQFRMEIYREVCNALDRLYDRSTEATANGSTASSDALHTLSPADANYQVLVM